MSKELNLIIAGLSGQGIVMAGRVLSSALLADGNDVFIADAPAVTHKNSTTFTEIRVGEDIHGLRIGEGTADLLLALEPDGLRVAILYAKEGGLVIMNDRVASRGRNEGLQDAVKKIGANVKVFPASDLAEKEVGRLITLNMVMLGAGVATGLIPVQPTTVEGMIRKLAPRGAADLNVAAFKVGMNRFKEQIDGGLN